MPSRTRKIPPNSDLHKKIITMLASRIKLAEREHQKRHEKWQKAEEQMLAYLPAQEEDLLRTSRRENQGQPQYTTIVVPYTYGTVMTMHTYLTSVFFGRNPIHQFAGRHGQTEMATQAIEALIGYQVEVGQFVGPYYIWLYDGLKYGTGILGEYWDNQIIEYARIEEVGGIPGVAAAPVQTTLRTQGYQGNRVYNVSPFNWLPDPRVPVGQFQTGEFVIERKTIPWSQLVKRYHQGFYMNIENLNKRSMFWGPNSDSSDGSSQLERPLDSELEFIDDKGSTETHPSVFRGYECHVDLIPKEWGLGEGTYPQKWVFTTTAQKDLLIGAQPHGAAHGDFPYSVIETEIEAYGLFNRGTPEIIEGIQNTVDWLLNTHFYNVRMTLNNQFIVDPSRIVMKDIMKGGPGLVVRLKPEAFGTDVRSIFQQIPVQDVTQSHLVDLQGMFQLSERVLGVNDAMMGVLGGNGNRTTATEVRTTTGFGVSRMKTIAEYLSATAFSRHAQHLLAQTQQYYDADMKLRVVGDLAIDAGPQFLQVNPQMIGGMYDFVPVDGTLPADRFAQATLWKDLFQQIVTIPEIAMQYDLGKVFAWVAQLAGLKNIRQFKLKMMDPAALAAAAAAGNVVPMRGLPAPGSDSTTQSGGAAAGPSVYQGARPSQQRGAPM